MPNQGGLGSNISKKFTVSSFLDLDGIWVDLILNLILHESSFEGVS